MRRVTGSSGAAAPALLLLAAGGAFPFAAPDPPGVYRIRARTTDPVAGVSLQTEDEITVRP